MKILISYRTVLFTLFLIGNIVKSQKKVDNSKLLNLWEFKKIDFSNYTYIYKRLENFDKKKSSIRFKKKGKSFAHLIKRGCGTGIIEDIRNNTLEFENVTGTWKKTSDTMITIKTSENGTLDGTFIILKLTDDELILRRNIKWNKK